MNPFRPIAFVAFLFASLFLTVSCCCGGGSSLSGEPGLFDGPDVEITIAGTDLPSCTLTLTADPLDRTFSLDGQNGVFRTEDTLFDFLHRKKPHSILYLSDKREWDGEAEFLTRLISFAKKHNIRLFLEQQRSTAARERVIRVLNSPVRCK